MLDRSFVIGEGIMQELVPWQDIQMRVVKSNLNIFESILFTVFYFQIFFNDIFILIKLIEYHFFRVKEEGELFLLEEDSLNSEELLTFPSVNAWTPTFQPGPYIARWCNFALVEVWLKSIQKVSIWKQSWVANFSHENIHVHILA
jgi:hypothetical protein